MTRWRQAGSPLLESLVPSLVVAALAVLLAALPAPALAQSPPPAPEPKTLTFDVSPDHAIVDPAGPRVVKYVVEFAPLDGGDVRTLDLGKPEAPNGTITVPLPQAQLPNGRWVATVRVVGTVTSTTSATVGPFQIGKARRTKSPQEQTRRAPTATAAPPRAPAAAEAPATPSDAQKRGFWKRIYGLIVG